MTIKKTDLTVCQIVRFTRLFVLDTENMKPNDDAMKGMNSKNSPVSLDWPCLCSLIALITKDFLNPESVTNRS